MVLNQYLFRLTLTCLGALWIIFPTNAQDRCDCFVKGYVLDKETKRPVPGATVYLKESMQGTTADSAGFYRIEKLCQGTYTLICRVVGYEETQQPFRLTHAAEQDFFITEDAIHLADVNVAARRTTLMSSQTATVLEGQSLDQTRGGTLGEALQQMAGVTSLQTGSSIVKPVIHGMHSNRVLILNNGIRQEGQQWGSEHAPEIDPFIASRITVVKGAAGVRYGSDAIGGVILVEPGLLPTDPAIRSQLNLAGFANGRQGVASFQTEGGLKAWKGFGWRLQGTLKRGGNIRTAHYFLDNTGIAEQNISAATGYRSNRFHTELFYSRFASRIGIFSGAHIGSLTDLRTIFENGRPLREAGFSYDIQRPYQDIRHDLLKWRTIWKPQGGGVWSLTLARQFNDRMEYDLHRPRNDSLAALNRPELRFRLTTYTGELVFEHKPIGRLSGSIGIDGLYQFNIMNGRPLIPNFRQFNTGLFWIGKLRLQQWELEGGIRYDIRHLQAFRFVNRVLTSPEFLFRNASGTLGLTRQHSERWTTRFNAGTAWRAPNVSELFSDGVHHGAAAYEQGNETLRPEVAYNLSLSTEYTGKRVQSEVSFFYNTIRNYIYLRPQAEPVLTIRGAFPAFRYTQTDALYAGADATVKATLLPRLELTSKASALYVQDRVLDQPIVMIPPNRWENSLRYNFGQVGRLQDVYASVGNLWVARQKRVPANSDFAPPPPAYSLWNLSAGFGLPMGETHRLDCSLTVTNLFNTAYRDYLNRFRYFAEDMGRNVALRAKWSF